jgi:hypothetical protein
MRNVKVQYIIASAGALVIIAGGFAAAELARRSFLDDVRERLRAAEVDGTLPDGIDPENPDLSDLGLEVTPEMMQKLAVSDFLFGLWFVWTPLVLVACFGAAALLRNRSTTSEYDPGTPS